MNDVKKSDEIMSELKKGNEKSEKIALFFLEEFNKDKKEILIDTAAWQLNMLLLYTEKTEKINGYYKGHDISERVYNYIDSNYNDFEIKILTKYYDEQNNK